MNNLYLSTIFAGANICLLTFFLLLVRRNDGERSRIILAFIILFSVFNYTKRYIDVSNGNEFQFEITAEMLLLALFMVTSYIMYPVEVISPGYLNLKRIVKIYTPFIIATSIFIVCKLIDIKFYHYYSMKEMINNITHFDVIFRLFIILLIFSPIITMFFTPHTRRYNNAGKSWVRKYIALFVINTIAYLIVITFHTTFFKIAYYYISVGCSLGIVYMELFERLIRKSSTIIDYSNNYREIFNADCDKNNEDATTGNISLEQKINQNIKTTSYLCEKIHECMEQKLAYRDPDLCIQTLSEMLNTNRTTLARAIQEIGYESFTVYVNTLRINYFIKQIEENKTSQFKTAFYDAGYRSRATAIRNFKLVTGKSPSEYFQKEHIL